MNDGMPFGADVLEDGKSRFGNGRPILARVGQWQGNSQVERLGLPGS